MWGVGGCFVVQFGKGRGGEPGEHAVKLGIVQVVEELHVLDRFLIFQGGEHFVYISFRKCREQLFVIGLQRGRIQQTRRTSDKTIRDS